MISFDKHFVVDMLLLITGLGEQILQLKNHLLSPGEKLWDHVTISHMSLQLGDIIHYSGLC